ncbi:MAG: hypothetical protein HC930_13970, partial [Hydrococcus sp. SU_1_0]|nr:hypothetical protein [Hydrococcus sp. SU_1_0]
MTNQSPSEPPNPIPERRRRPATGVTFDEMIAIIIAFSTIGTILFWALGGRNGKLANNFGLGGESSLLASGKTTNTGVGFGNILSDNNQVSETNLDQRDAQPKARRLATQTEKPDTAVADFSATPRVDSSAQVAPKKSLSFDTGAKLAPLAGVATLPALRGRSENLGVSGNKPQIQTKERVDNPAPDKIEPQAKTPENT